MTGWSNGQSFNGNSSYRTESLTAARAAQESWIFRLMLPIQDRRGL